MISRKYIDELQNLKEALKYDMETGLFRWVTSPARNVKAGSIAGNNNAIGRVVIRFKGRAYYASVLAYLFSVGIGDFDVIDHINGNPSDNRILNLRPASYAENTWNRAVSNNNKMGIKGIRYVKKHNFFKAQIFINGVKYENSFKSLERAIKWRNSKARELQGEFCFSGKRGQNA